MLVRRGVNGAKSHEIMRRNWKLCERRKHVHSTFWCEPCDVACEKPCADVSDTFMSQPYRTNHDLTFDTLVSEKPRNIIRIAYFDTWLRDVLSFSTRPPTYQIAATVNEMTSDENRKSKDSGMNPRKRQKLVIPDKSLNMAVSNSNIQREKWNSVT